MKSHEQSDDGRKTAAGPLTYMVVLVGQPIRKERREAQGRTDAKALDATNESVRWDVVSSSISNPAQQGAN